MESTDRYKLAKISQQTDHCARKPSLRTYGIISDVIAGFIGTEWHITRIHQTNSVDGTAWRAGAVRFIARGAS
jgi:hypothetical protein